LAIQSSPSASIALSYATTLRVALLPLVLIEHVLERSITARSWCLSQA